VSAFDPNSDAGVAVERTALAWNRTGLSAAAGGGIALKAFWGRSVLGLGLAALLLTIGALAYAEGAASYRARRAGTMPGDSARIRLHALSLAMTAAAGVAVAVAIVG
jgi:uncharacterized membrane protein YidH (DUF202 family)